MNWQEYCPSYLGSCFLQIEIIDIARMIDKAKATKYSKQSYVAIHILYVAISKPKTEPQVSEKL